MGDKGPASAPVLSSGGDSTVQTTPMPHEDASAMQSQRQREPNSSKDAVDNKLKSRSPAGDAQADADLCAHDSIASKTGQRPMNTDPDAGNPLASWTGGGASSVGTLAAASEC